MYFVYVLYSQKDKKLYIGFTKNLDDRIRKHKEGGVNSTRHRIPLELIYYEAFKDKRDATKREYFLKRGRGREFLKKILKHSLPG
jgi:putative endonuclease